MNLTVIGCSGSVPGPANPGSCYLVQARDPATARMTSIVLDLGNGSLGALQECLHPMDLDAVVLSHLHADHCIDVTALAVWAQYGPGRERREDPIQVYGPPATARRLGRAYGAEDEVDLSEVFDVRTVTDGVPFSVGPLQITPIAVRHPVPAFGFRVALEDGPVLAYTGDTDSCPALTPLMTGAGLVLADCAYVDGRDEQEGIHLSGSRAGEAATVAGGVGTLVLTHLTPWTDPDVVRAQARSTWAGALQVAEPGASYVLTEGAAPVRRR